MKIHLPTDLKRLVYPELNLVELNDTDVERMMTSIFEMAVKGGRTASSLKNAKLYWESLDGLIAHAKVEGFEGSHDRDVMDGWLRSSVVQMGRAGLSRAEEQMQFIRPQTIGVYRSGFPSRGRHRRADALVYSEMRAEMRRRLQRSGDQGAPEKRLSELFFEAVGDGVTISDPPKWAPSYDGKSPIDISALLTLYFLEGFEPKSATQARSEVPPTPVPCATRPIGSDILDYLATYGRQTPASTIAIHLSALIGLRLFQLPLLTGVAVRRLISSGDVPSEMRDDGAPNPLEQYVDFVGEKGSASDQVARACVQRDLDVLRQAFADRLYLRSIREATEIDPDFVQQTEYLDAGERFGQIASMAETPGVVAYLQMQINRIRHENSDTDDEDAKDFITRLSFSDRPAAWKLTDLLVEELKKRGYENSVKWFWSTGGIKSEVGLLSGTLKGRRTWAYAPKDSLITAMLSVIFVQSNGLTARRDMPLSELLEKLESRFGLLIDRPPTAMNTAENRAAAAQNLDAFKRRLQLLGAFDGLSDDYSAQRVRNPIDVVKRNE